MQVKSCSYRPNGGAYMCLHRAPGRTRYSANDFDYFACYIVPEDLWYIIPMRVLLTKTGRLPKSSIALAPHFPESKFHPYLEHWDLLRGRGGRIRRIEASAGADLERFSFSYVRTTFGSVILSERPGVGREAKDLLS